MTRLLGVLVLVGSLVLTACGVSPQSRPQRIEVTSPTVPAMPEAEGGSLTLTVYFVHGTRLQGVPRSTAEVSAAAALALLVAGPSRDEVASGIRTAVSPQALTTVANDSTAGTVVVAGTDEFTTISGTNQLLAVAQLVWTVTEVPGVRRVRLTVDGRPLEVPTDRGLTPTPVGRSDYLSVAPGETPTPSTSRTPSNPATTT